MHFHHRTPCYVGQAGEPAVGENAHYLGARRLRLARISSI
jgi:hypothetical protein